MPWGAIIGAGASILGGLMGSKSQKSANSVLSENSILKTRPGGIMRPRDAVVARVEY